MTTGNVLIGSSGSDFLFQKIWQGDDSPKVQNSAKPPKAPKTFQTVWEVDKNGNWVRKRKYIYVRPKSRTSKRARRRDPHYYTMARLTNYQPAYQLHQKGAPQNDVYWYGFRSSATVHPTSPITDNVKISVIKELANSLRGGTDFDASVFLGTAGQSLRTIAQASIRIAGALAATKKGRLKDAFTMLTGKTTGPKNRSVTTDKAMSSAWLELQYGWRPLVQDIYEGGSVLASILQDPFVFRKRASRTYRVDASPSTGTGTTATSWATRSSRFTYAVIGYFKEQPNNIYKLGLNDPSSLAWELLPWSFVIDWAVPVGDYLRARGDASSLKGTFVESTLRYTRVSDLYLNGSNPNVDAIRNASLNSSSRSDFTRTVSTTLNVPRPEFKPLNKVLSWQHTANAVALLLSVNKTFRV